MSRSFDSDAFTRLWRAMSDAERAPVQAKARWEQMTVSAVLFDYDDMIPPRLAKEKAALWATVRDLKG